ncbi:hypothetical protein ABIB40_002571 [Pedobacter sp. UYP30]|uniref:hypothetical protein n=1 Tax=Pedobacter sp. UYP30 TaxID=1756400 RepID=UPI003396D92F
MKHCLLILLSFTLLLQNCKKSKTAAEKIAIDSSKFTKAQYNGLDIKKDLSVFSSVAKTCFLQDKSLVEQSGVASSGINESILYIHQDSGNAPVVNIINTDGKSIGKITLLGVQNRDWEDIAVGPGPEKDKSYIYVGNIGDNDAVYPEVTIYRFLEPEIAKGDEQQNFSITQFDRITLKYPNAPRNAESLMIDPLSKDIYIASKESNHSYVYKASYPQSTSSTTMLIPLVELPFDKITGGDISPDGQEILLRSKAGVWYWHRSNGETISTTLLKTPTAVSINPEHQGEGICFAHNGSGFYTNSEVPKDRSMLPSLSFYKRK